MLLLAVMDWHFSSLDLLLFRRLYSKRNVFQHLNALRVPCAEGQCQKSHMSA